VIDRQKVIAQVQALHDRDDPDLMAEQFVDQVLIPLLKEHDNLNERQRTIAAVDACGQMYIAAIARQRAAIQRLLDERAALKDRIREFEERDGPLIA